MFFLWINKAQFKTVLYVYNSRNLTRRKKMSSNCFSRQLRAGDTLPNEPQNEHLFWNEDHFQLCFQPWGKNSGIRLNLKIKKYDKKSRILAAWKAVEKFDVQICSSKSQNTLNIYCTRAAGYSTLIKCRAARKCTKFKLLIFRFIFFLFTSTHRLIVFTFCYPSKNVFFQKQFFFLNFFGKKIVLRVRVTVRISPST